MPRAGKRALDFVTIKVIGPKSIMQLRPSFIAAARLDVTWYDFLSHNGVKLTPRHGVRVATLRAPNGSTTPTKNSWTANLGERVCDFIWKFQRNRQVYSVRLYCQPGNDGGGDDDNDDDGGDHVTKRSRHMSAPAVYGLKESRRSGSRSRTIGNCSSTSYPARVIRKEGTSDIYRKPRYTPGQHGTQKNGNGARTRQMTSMTVEAADSGMIPVAGASMAVQAPAREVPVAGTSVAVQVQAPAREVPVAGTSIQIGRIKYEERSEQNWDSIEQFEVGEEGGINLWDGEQVANEEEDDNPNQGTSPPPEKAELAPEDLNPLDNLKAFASQRLIQHGNPHLLRIRKEIMRLKQHGSWIRNFQRAPLACYLLEDILYIT